MNKAELISAVAKQSGLKRTESEKAVKAVFDVITSQLAEGEKVQIVGFGIFDVTNRKERTGRNPFTQEEMEIGPSRTPKFKAGKALKDAVNRV